MIKILTSLAALLTIGTVQSQNSTPEMPKLVIGITIDQLRGDYLDFFKQNFTEKGFNRLFREGLVYQNIRFDFPDINAENALATIYTGADPFVSGIASAQTYNRAKGKLENTFADDAYTGSNTNDKLSPLALKASTIGDELKIASGGHSDVYAFAPNASEALIAAGKTANAGFWIDSYSAKWATTNYYKTYNWSVMQRNRDGKALAIQGFSTVWRPLLAYASYKAFPYTTQVAGFTHTFGASGVTLLKKSPFVNGEITETAILALEKAELGKRVYPDMLSITLYAGNFPKASDKNYSIELQDTYLRLDRQLGDFLDAVDKAVGLPNTLIFLTSTGYYLSEEPDGTTSPTLFYPNRCTSLLNMYLMASYGREQWVDGIFGNQIFLNRKLIESRNIDLKAIREKTAEFAAQFSGVQDVATASQMLSGEQSDGMAGYRKLFNRETAGDVILRFAPGVKIVDEKETSAPDYRIRNNAVASPVIFFGFGIKPQRIGRTINAKEIAPTISYILRIRSPNAAEMGPLSEFMPQ